MMDWTDRHCRYFLRGFSPRGAAVHGDDHGRGAAARRRAPAAAVFARRATPGAAARRQRAGPARAAARLGEQAGYREINLNCGCPSDRVHAGAFGACLMARTCAGGRLRGRHARGRDGSGNREDAHRRASVAAASRCASDWRPTTSATTSGCVPSPRPSAAPAAGSSSCTHARPCWADCRRRKIARCRRCSREVVRRLAGDFPQLALVLNGGVRTRGPGGRGPDVVRRGHAGARGLPPPYVISELHQRLFADGWQRPAEEQLLERMAALRRARTGAGVALAAITRHMLGLYAGQPGARAYRQRLSEGARDPARAPGCCGSFPTCNQALTRMLA